MTVLGNVIMVAVVGRGVYWMAGEPCKTTLVPELMPR